jgi:hypothetical protein
MPYLDKRKNLACNRRYQKRMRTYRRKHKLCIHCGAPVSKGHTACNDCLESQRLRMKL